MKKELTVLSMDTTILWAKNLPILITETGVVTCDQDAAGALLLLEFQNICEEPIIAVRFDARCYDLLKRELEPISGQVVQDFCLNPGDIWSAEHLFSFPSVETRRVEIAVTEVLFQNGDIWKNVAGEFSVPFEPQAEISLPIEQMAELSRQKEMARVERYPYRYQPKKGDGHWRCACGQVNIADRCVQCNVAKDVLFQITQSEFLIRKMQERIEEEKRIEEERARIAAERREAVRTKYVIPIRDHLSAHAPKLLSLISVVAEKICGFYKTISGFVSNASKKTFRFNPSNKQFVIGALFAVIILVGVLVVSTQMAYQNSYGTGVAEETTASQLQKQEEKEKRPDCKGCNGYGGCMSCNKGQCSKCGGRGAYREYINTPYMQGTRLWNCDKCDGDGRCVVCNGADICPVCNRKGSYNE